MLRFFSGLMALVAAVLAAAGAGAEDHPRNQDPRQNFGAGYRLLKLDEKLVKWGEAALGRPAHITYALIDRPMQFDDARNCRAMAPMGEGLAVASSAGASTSAEIVRQAFAVWTAAANISFERSASPETADILIGLDAGQHGWAHADVKPAPSTDGNIVAIERSLVCLNGARKWKIGFGGDAGAQDLRHTLIHEIGHALGLNHPGAAGQIMAWRYGEEFTELQAGDISGAQTLYGPPASPALAARGANQTALQ